MTDTRKAKAPQRKEKPRRPADETAFVVSDQGGVFEHLADDLDEDEADSVYLRDVQHD